MSMKTLEAKLPGCRVARFVTRTKHCQLSFTEHWVYSLLTRFKKPISAKWLSKLSRLHRTSTIPKALQTLRALGLVARAKDGRWLGRPPGQHIADWFSQRSASSWRKKFRYQAFVLPSVDSPLKLVDAVVYSQLLLTPALPDKWLASRFGLDRRTVAASKKRIAKLQKDNGGKIVLNWFLADKMTKNKTPQPSQPAAPATPPAATLQTQPEPKPQPQPESLANIGPDFSISIAGQKNQHGSLVDQIMQAVRSSSDSLRKTVQRAINKMRDADWNDREAKRALLAIYELRCQRAADPEDKFSDEMFEVLRPGGNLDKALSSAEKGNGFGLFMARLGDTVKVIQDNDQEIMDDQPDDEDLSDA